MLVLIVASLVALIITFYASRDEIPYGLEIAFLLITFVAAVHYNYGNDYIEYERIFNAVTQHDFSVVGLVNHSFYNESGWAFLCFLFKPFGFLWMVVFLSVIENLAYYMFIRFYVPKNWWALGLFIYLTSKCLYVLNMSMMRQGLAIALFVCLWSLIKSKSVQKIIVATCVVFLLTTIHSSAVILYPFVLWGFIPMRFGTVNGVLLLVVFIVLFFSVDLINSILIQFADVEELQLYFKAYEGSSTSKYGFGFVLLTLPFILGLCFLIFNKKASFEEKQLVTIASVGSIVVPFTQVISLLGRIGYYFAPFTLASIPIAYRWIPDPWRKGFVVLFVLISCYDYWLFFHSEIYSNAYLIFHSIFEVIF